MEFVVQSKIIQAIDRKSEAIKPAKPDSAEKLDGCKDHCPCSTVRRMSGGGRFRFQGLFITAFPTEKSEPSRGSLEISTVAAFL